MHPVFVFAKHNYEGYFLPISQKLNELGEIVTHSDLLDCIKKRHKEGYQKAMLGHLKPYWEFIGNFS